jgi:hypothetical protein
LDVDEEDADEQGRAAEKQNFANGQDAAESRISQDVSPETLMKNKQPIRQDFVERATARN